MEMNVKPHHYAEYIGTHFTTVGVRLGSKNPNLLTFKVPKEWLPKIEVGKTRAVCASLPKGATELSFGTGVIEEVHADPKIDFSADFEYRYLVQLIDFSAFNALTEAEKEFNDTAVSATQEAAREKLRAQFEAGMPEKARLGYEAAKTKLDAGLSAMVNGSASTVTDAAVRAIAAPVAVAPDTE